MSGSIPSLNVFAPGVGNYPASWANTAVQGGCYLANLRTFSGITNMTVMMVGYVSINDGGQGLFVWVMNTGGVDDGGVTTIVPYGNTQGYWERITSAGAQGPVGPAGPAGPPGPTGPAGPAGPAAAVISVVAAQGAVTLAQLVAGGVATAASVNTITQPLTGHYYENEGGNIDRFADRVLVGGATVSDANDPFSLPGNVTKDWLGVLQAAIGLNPASEATLVSLQSPGDSGLGNIGVLGGSQSLSFTNPGQSAIGVAGYAYNNSTTLSTASWAYYGESYRLQNGTNNTYGFELAVIQQSGVAHPITPYFGGTAGYVIGLQLDSGNGFNQTAQPGLISASAALTVSQNTTDSSAPWLRGIVFFTNSLKLNGGVGEALSFASGHAMQWYNTAGSATSAILANTATTGGSTSVVMTEGSLEIGSPGYSALIAQFNVVPSAVNYLVFQGNAASSAPSVSVAGTDTNINLVLSTKGSGTVVLASTVQPNLDNTFSAGVSGARFASVWAANGTIQTSDPSLKTDISPLPDVLPVVMSINPVTYKWINGGNRPVTTDIEAEEDVYEIVAETVEDHEVQPDGSVHLITKTVNKRRQVFDEVPVTTPDGSPVIDRVPINRKGCDPIYIDQLRTFSAPRKQRVTKAQTTYEPAPGGRTHWGFLAPDVKAAVDKTGLDFGGYVKGEDGIEALRPDQLIPLLWKGVQELATQVVAMKAEIAALTGSKGT